MPAFWSAAVLSALFFCEQIENTARDQAKPKRQRTAALQNAGAISAIALNQVVSSRQNFQPIEPVASIALIIRDGKRVASAGNRRPQRHPNTGGELVPIFHLVALARETRPGEGNRESVERERVYAGQGKSSHLKVLAGA